MNIPSFTSWGELILVLLGVALAVKYLFPLLRGENGQVGEWRGKVEQLLVSNSELLHEMAQGHQDVIRLLEEIERRSRDQDEAIRIVLQKGGLH